MTFVVGIGLGAMVGALIVFLIRHEDKDSLSEGSTAYWVRVDWRDKRCL